MKNVVKSYWNVPLEGRFINNNSHTLCIVLPGVRYLLDRSYLDYSSKMASDLKMDVYEVEYGFQIARSSFDIPSQFEILANETIPSILEALPKKYSHYVIIAKSIGTCLQVLLNHILSQKEVSLTNVYISPINQTVDMGITPHSLVFAGLSDPLLSHDSIEKIKHIHNIKLVTIPNANHSLDIPGDMIKTVETLKENLMIIKDFIS